MFTVKYHNNGFMISTGDGSPVYARDVDELHRAIDHYFCRQRHRERTMVEGCPLCRWVAEKRLIDCLRCQRRVPSVHDCSANIAEQLAIGGREEATNG